jgi:hypothetical protein
MVYYLSYIRDSVGNNYIGLKIPYDVVSPFLEKLKDHLSEDEYKIYIENQQKRDGGTHHITVINVMEYNKLSKETSISKFVESIEDLSKYPIDDLKMMGVGSASRNENTAYFIVCKSEKLDAIKKRYNLPPQDFHVTLGFKWKDVFGVPKNKVLESKSKFLELLKLEFYKKENFNFLKRIDNYQTNPDFDIIPISISDKYLKIYSDGVIMDIGILDDQNKLWVMATYKAEKEPVRLPMTEILKTLKK